MSKYIVRINCEYSVLIEAEDEEQAEKEADDMPTNCGAWDEAWSGYEVEPYD